MKSIILYSYWFINGLFFTILIPFNKLIKIKEKWILLRIRQIAKRTIRLTGSNILVEGLENIKSDNFLMVSNHESLFDPIIITSVIDKPHTYVAKKEVSKVLVLKFWGEKIKTLFIDRDDMRASMKMIIAAIQNTKNGTNYLIFPEGTRNVEDQEFKSGSLKIAQSAKVNIIPITIRNSSALFEKNKKIKSAEVKVKIHSEFTYEEYKELDIVEISSRVQAIINGYK